MSSADYDVIAAEVHRKALENLTNEMGITMVRTSGSPVVVEGKDFSACLLDRTPEHLGFAAYVLFHIGSSLVGTQEVVASLPEGKEVRPGDGWIVNDPHEGGAAHQGDLGIIMPMFHEERHMGWAFSNMHVLDVGGVGVGGYAVGAHDVYQEGMRFPPVQIIRDGAIDREWAAFIAANVRAPHPVLNDIRSMIASNNIGNRKLSQIIDEFGMERYEQFCEINKSLSEQLMRRRIEAIPDGIYHAVDWDEFDGHGDAEHLLEMKLRLEVDGSNLRFHFSGVPQIDAFVNSAKGAMWGATLTPLLTMLAYGDLPVNGGFLRPIEVDLGEPGTIVNATLPVPVSNAHTEVGVHASRLVRDVVCQALALSEEPVLRSRITGQPQDAFTGHIVWGDNQHGGISVHGYFDTVQGTGGGGQTIGDGLDTYGMTATTGGHIEEVETHEALDPHIWLWRNLVPNAAGPGFHRGGAALEQGYVLAYGERFRGPAFNGCAQVPPHGTGGGYPASTNDFYVIRDTDFGAALGRPGESVRTGLGGRREELRSKTSHFEFGRGDVPVFCGGGGGGLGDPILRPPEWVAKDIAAGYITADHAAAIYGVVVDGAELDREATARRRAEILRERIGSEPAKPLTPPAQVGISVLRGESGWSCASCGEGLGASSENWREHAVLLENEIHARMSELKMHVRPRGEGPEVRMREHFCPGCAACLTVDVVTEGLATLPTPQLSETRAAVTA